MEYELNKSRCTIKLFVNGQLLCTKFFRNRRDKSNWMKEMTEKMKGINDIYFELAHDYSARALPKWQYQKEYRENKRIDKIVNNLVEQQ